MAQVQVKFEQLLEQANQAVQVGDYQSARATLETALAQQPDHTGVLTGLGTVLLCLDEIALAYERFSQVVNLEPGSADAHNNLGLTCAALEKIAQAEAAYQQALVLDPEHWQAWKNLAELYLAQTDRLQDGVQVLSAVVQANPADAQAIMRLAECYEEGGELDSARNLFLRVQHLQPDYPAVQQALARIDEAWKLRRQTGRLAKPEHIAKLASLKNRSQDDTPKNPPNIPALVHQPRRVMGQTLRIGITGAKDRHSLARLTWFVRGLTAAGQQVTLIEANPNANIPGLDVLVLVNPAQHPAAHALIAQARHAGQTIVLDIDRDLPGLVEPKPGAYRDADKRLAVPDESGNAWLAQADLVTTTSRALAERVAQFGILACYVLPGWDEQNPLWQKPAPKRRTFNLGISGQYTRPEDAQILVSEMSRLLAQFPQSLLVISDNLALYRVFQQVPEARKLFLPETTQEDFPFQLGQFDLLLVPQAAGQFNQLRSDQPLVEAGVRSLPWVATYCEAFAAWGSGGMLLTEGERWLTPLRALMEDGKRLKQLGAEGQRAAETRRVLDWQTRWLEQVAAHLRQPVKL